MADLAPRGLTAWAAKAGASWGQNGVAGRQSSVSGYFRGGLLGGMGRFPSVPPRQNRLGPPLEVHQMTQGVVEIRIYSELTLVGS